MPTEPQVLDAADQLRAGVRECVNHQLLLRECPAALLASPLRDRFGLAASAAHRIYASVPPLLLDLDDDSSDKLVVLTHCDMDSFDRIIDGADASNRRRCFRAATRAVLLLARYNFIVDWEVKRTRFLVGFHLLRCTVNLETLRGC